MVVLGLAIIVAGMGSQGSEGWTSKYIIYISLYAMWILLTLFFVYLDFSMTSVFVIHGLLHVTGTAVVSWFTFKVLKADPHTIQFFLPLCADGGIFLWTATKYAWLGLREIVDDHLSRSSEVVVNHYRSTRRALLLWIISALGEGRQPPQLPFSNDNGSRGTLLQTFSFPSQDLDQDAPQNPGIDNDEDDPHHPPQNPPNL